MFTSDNQDLFADQDSLVYPAEEIVDLTDETVCWRAREASFMGGKWGVLSKRIPRFIISDFKATDTGPVNPHIRTVVRQPLTVTEHPIPVGVVSNTYCLAQHADVVEMCLKGIQAQGLDPQELRCEVGLTPLGEWMNFRAYFPECYDFNPEDNNKVSLRLECFNSVDGSSRLVIVLGWIRFICSNGLIIGETRAELRDIHNQHLNLGKIPKIIQNGVELVKNDLARLRGWEKTGIEWDQFEKWVDGHLTEQWGKKAACRTLHICREGSDVQITDPFEGGVASKKTVEKLGAVPGAPNPAKNLYDVCQALSWIATQRNNAEERLEWQTRIPKLMANLKTLIKAA